MLMRRRRAVNVNAPGLRPELRRAPTSPPEDGDGAHGRARPAAYLERQADEAEPAPAGQQVQVAHVLVVREAQLAADAVDLPVRDAAHARRGRLHAEGRNALPAQPARRPDADARPPVPVVRPVRAPVVVGVEQDGVAAFDLEAGAGERALQVFDLYQ